jgi:predicted ArsR family transcriptional regulator
VLAHLRREGPCSTADVAGALKVSEMTALRTIRGLAARGLVVRRGKGPSTRYTAVDRQEEKRGDA